ncbi:MAG TPA: SAM-dependent chlorinase/fluorinase [Edaphocola sp.]|nr:SAM-dependent chlorinase/fluorinase [Edaphocola sp.]
MIATLISDFGTKDNSIAVSKGMLLRYCPTIQFIDITHEVEEYNLTQCSYLLKSSFSVFPEHTVHISLFGIMEQHPAVVLLAKVDNHYFISADNGLLEFTFSKEKLKVWRLNNSESNNFLDWLKNSGSLLKDIENIDESWIQSNMTVHTSVKQLPDIQPELTNEGDLKCRVIHIDEFGNIILNITIEAFDEFRNGRTFSIFPPRQNAIEKIVNNFDGLVKGMPYCMVNSAGYLQLGLYKGNAADLYGFNLFDVERIIFDTIKIEFK